MQYCSKPITVILVYSKLFASILDSSVWLQPEPTRIVWLTLLAAKDEDGFSRFATVSNLALRARVSPDAATEAVRVLEAPDPDSSNPENEGRRIERVPGGWIVLNAKTYDDIARHEQELQQNRERVRRHREKNGVRKKPLARKAAAPTPTNGKADPSVQSVLDHYFKTHPRRRPSESDIKVVTKALKLGYSPADLCEAITGNATDAWHVDKRKHELSYVLRNTELIDNFREKAAAKKNAPPQVDAFGVMSPEFERLTRP